METTPAKVTSATGATQDLKIDGTQRISKAQWRTGLAAWLDRKSTRLNSSHANISYAVFCLKKKKLMQHTDEQRCKSKKRKIIVSDSIASGEELDVRTTVNLRRDVLSDCCWRHTAYRQAVAL